LPLAVYYIVMKVKWPELIACIGICLGVGFIGSVFTAPAITSWYAFLNKPFFNPPNWIFGPVWTLLYILMGISVYSVLTTRPKSDGYNHALQLFALQLVFNFLWSVIFFGLRNLLAAFLEIIILWIAILLTWQKFKKISRTAANLLIPYIAWVSFALILNLAIVFLN